MEINWLFTSSAGNWALAEKTFEATQYQNLVIPDSFSGITESSSSAESGLLNATSVSFKAIGDFSSLGGQDLTIRLLADDVVEKTWKFKVDKATNFYGTTTIYAVSSLNSYLDGDYPNTKSPTDIWGNDVEDEESTIPVVFGDAYIPLKSVYTGTTRGYVLGSSSNTYSISKVRSPKEWGNDSTWDSSDYTFNQVIAGSYKILQPIIADKDLDGSADSSGLWLNGDTFYNMPTKFTSSAISASSTVSPDIIIKKFLLDIGVASGDINDAIFTATGATCTANGIAWSGGFYKKESREAVLASLLLQSNTSIYFGSSIELIYNDFSSKITFDSSDILSQSFNSSAQTQKIASDGGYIEYTYDADTPQDRPYKALVWSTSSQTSSDDVSNPESTTLSMPFISNSVVAQKLGVMAFNRKLNKGNQYSLKLKPDVTYWALRPNQVGTINEAIYGGSTEILITSITYDRTGSISISGVSTSGGLLDFSEINASVLVKTEDTPETLDLSVDKLTAAVRINYRNFDTVANNYAYIHGYDYYGQPLQDTGFIWYNGTKYAILNEENGTDWTLFTSQSAVGYIIFDVGLNNNYSIDDGTVLSLHNSAFVTKLNDIWYYDNGTAWVEFTPTVTDRVIGDLYRIGGSISSANIWEVAKEPSAIISSDVDNSTITVLQAIADDSIFSVKEKNDFKYKWDELVVQANDILTRASAAGFMHDTNTSAHSFSLYNISVVNAQLYDDEIPSSINYNDYLDYAKACWLVATMMDSIWDTEGSIDGSDTIFQYNDMGTNDYFSDFTGTLPSGAILLSFSSSDFVNIWINYYEKAASIEASLATGLTAQQLADIDTATNIVNDITADNIYSITEKESTKPDWEQQVQAFSSVNQTAIDLSLDASTEYLDFVAKGEIVLTIMETIWDIPPYDAVVDYTNMGQSTTLGIVTPATDGTETAYTRANISDAWNSYWTAKAVLENKINATLQGQIDTLSDSTLALATNTSEIVTDLPAIDFSVANFNRRNDRLSTLPADPVIANDGTAIDFSFGPAGGVIVNFAWSYDGTDDAHNIDGFVVYGASSASPVGADFTTETQITYSIIEFDKREAVFTDVPAELYYTIGIQAFRVVDPDIDSSGVLRSNIIQPTFAGENPIYVTRTIPAPSGINVVLS